MNETRQALFCLKMSPLPRKENRSSDWLLWKGGGWDRRPFSPGPWKGCSAFNSDLVMSRSGASAPFSSLYTGQTVCPKKKGATIRKIELYMSFVEKKTKSPALARYIPSQCPWHAPWLSEQLCTVYNLSLNMSSVLSTKNWKGRK